jgi:hypothetical protein
MTLFACGCIVDGERCPVHSPWDCHDFDGEPRTFRFPDLLVCPLCNLARLRSVSLSPKATPTRGRKS